MALQFLCQYLGFKFMVFNWLEHENSKHSAWEVILFILHIFSSRAAYFIFKYTCLAFVHML